MFRIAAFLLALCLGVSAQAQIFGPAVYTPTVTSGGGYTGPGDVVGGVAHFYGMEAVNTAYATGSKPAFDYSCTGGSPATGTINILSTGFADAATLSAACGANAITVTKIYDQVGTVNIDTVVAGTVTVTLNCIGSHPCFTSSGAGCLASSTTLSLTAPFTIAGSYQLTVTPAANQRVLSLFGGGTEAMVGGNATPAMIGYHGTILAATAPITGGTFYAVAAAFDATGTVGVNGSTNTGTIGNTNISGAKVGLTTTSASSCINGAGSKTLDIGVWPSSWTSSNMSSASAQERSNFGF